MANLQHNPETPQDLTLSFLEKITNKFDEAFKIGTGGFGDVYWGIYRDEKIAVKKLHEKAQGFNDKAFKKEFNNSLKLHHPNTVRLVGYCYETRRIHMEVKKGEFEFVGSVLRVLCFEYCEGGSLEKYIYEKFRERDLDTRLKIIRGVSEGLNYLHNGQAKNNGQANHMYHLDLKPENILLDEENMPKIADFGLSRFLATTKTQITTSPCTGTNGYMPPEYIDDGKISSKFDVFSLGVIILQLFAVPLGYSKKESDDGMSPREFVEQVRTNWRERPPSELYRVKEYIDIALKCVEKERDNRPKIKDIVIQLKAIDARYSAGSSSSRIKHLLLDPALELRFPFERSKEIPCCLQLTNNTAGFIAFNIKMDQKKYHAHPNKGTVQPRSNCDIVITSQAWKTDPPSRPPPGSIRRGESILVQSTRVGGDLTADDIADNMFDTSTGNAVDQVELPVVYVPILQHPTFE